MQIPRRGFQAPSLVDNDGTRLVVFRLDAQRYALPLHVIERVVRAVAVTPLPDSPSVVLGVIDVAGQLVPVFNVRRKFGLPERSLALDDHLVIAQSAYGTVALVTDGVEGVIERSRVDTIPAEPLVPGLDHVDGVARFDDGLVLIQNLARFLSAQEVNELNAAMER